MPLFHFELVLLHKTPPDLIVSSVCNQYIKDIFIVDTDIGCEKIWISVRTAQGAMNGKIAKRIEVRRLKSCATTFFHDLCSLWDGLVGLIIAEAYLELRFIILMCRNVCLVIDNRFLICFRNIWIL